jgi:hypothetical protein
MRYSYVLHFPASTSSFDDLTHRWPTFLGEFVKPIAVKYPDLLFWCSFYGECARYRVHCGRQEIEDFTIKTIKEIGLAFDLTEEATLSLSTDLGSPRFIDPSLGSDAINRRADFILRFLCSTVRLYLDGLEKIDDKHWQYRPTKHKENPLGNNFESLAHLMANISQFEFDVFPTAGTFWHQTRLPPTLRCRL